MKLIDVTSDLEDLIKNRAPEYVMLTIDSLGESDPALTAQPDLPFVFNGLA